MEPLRTESAREVSGEGTDGGLVRVVISDGRCSASGGGVGGNMLRFMGGSDCWRDLLERSVRTRFEAAYEIFSGGRSSRIVSGGGMVLLFSGPAKPVEIFVLSAEAINRAFPR